MKHITIILSFLLLPLGRLSAQISVAQYLDDVMTYSHSISQAEATIEGADAELRISRKGFLPRLSVAGDIDLNFRNREGRQWGWSPRVDIEQPIYTGGALRAELRSSERAVDAAHQAMAQAELATEYDAEMNYWRLSRAEIYRMAVSDYLSIVTTLRDVVARRFDEGYTSKSDLLQVESRISDAEYQLSAAEQEYELALHNFNILRGVEPTTRVELANSILDSMTLPQRVDADYVMQHPDYRLSLAEQDIARWTIRSHRSRFLPSIGLNIYGYAQPKQPHVAGGGVIADGGVVLTISSPIFHFRERRDVVRIAESEYRKATMNVDDVADRLHLEESNGWTNLQTTRSRVDAIRRNLRLAEENLSISTYAYGEGSATILDVLQAQLSWLQIYTNAITAQYDYAVAIAAYRAITATQFIEKRSYPQRTAP